MTAKPLHTIQTFINSNRCNNTSTNLVPRVSHLMCYKARVTFRVFNVIVYVGRIFGVSLDVRIKEKKDTK